MRTHVLELTRGREVAATAGVGAFLGVALMFAPALERALLIVGVTGLLTGLTALVLWLLRDHRDLEWSTYGGTLERVRGSDYRITTLARSIDASLVGDKDATQTVRSVLQSLAQARLVPLGLTLDGPPAQAEAVLGRDFTAYLTSSDPQLVDARTLASFITTLEEH